MTKQSTPPDPQQPPSGRASALTLLAIFVIAAGTYGAVFVDAMFAGDPSNDLQTFIPTPTNRDPSLVLPGVVTEQVTGNHVGPDDRVAYPSIPPTGGSHAPTWAACNGTVHDRPLRTENAVHSLEHGAVWIAFDPERITGDQLARLADRVRDVPYTMMSPYPGLPAAISLQAWGHRLVVSDVADAKIDQFVTALRRNPYTHPETGASCTPPPDAAGSGPFLPAPPASDVGRNGVRAADEPGDAPQPDTVPGGK